MKTRFFAIIFPIIAVLFAVYLTGSMSYASDQPEIRVGAETNFSPYSFVDENGQAAGFSVDLIKAVAGVMGLSIKISSDRWDVLWNELVSGQIDVLPIVARSPGRQELVDFSLTHTETYDSFFTRKGIPAIKNIDAARGKKILVMRSDAAHQELQARNFRNELVIVNSIPEGMSLLSSGEYDALLCSKLIGSLEIKKHGIKGLIAGPPIPDYKRVFSFAVKKGNHELLEKLNQGLLIIKTSGEYDQYYENWLSIEEPWRKYEKNLGLALAIFIVIALFAGLLLLILQKMVRKRTRELGEINEMLRLAKNELDERIAQRTAELTESKERYKSYVEVTGQIGWSTDLDGLVIGDMPSWRKFTGQTPDEIKGWGWSNAIHPDDLARVKETWTRSVSERSGYETEYQIRRHDGVYRHFLARGIPVFRKDGTIQEWVGTSIDITERKKTEDELKKIREDLTQAQSVGNIGSWRLDIQKNELTWSDETYRIFCIPIGTALTYETFISAVHPDDRAYVEEEWQAGLSGKPYDIEHRIVVAGKIKWVREKAYLEFDKDGKLLGGFGTAQDITKKRLTEDELRRAHDELEIRVRERTMELQKSNESLQAEILEKKKIDEKKNVIEAQMLRAQRMESIGTLAAGIAHDFNNILTPIVLNATATLMDIPENNHLRKYQERILSSANRARDLVHQILTFSRKGEYALKIVKFEDILIEALNLLRASIPSTIEISQTINPSGAVLADPTQIHQVIMNLCTNAYQAMRESGGRLEISLDEVEVDAELLKRNMNLRSGRYVRFTVRDTGPGMDKATMERIFDPFFTTKGTGGTGLGLSVVQGIVIGLGGEIDVQSQTGRGATFHVYLPRASNEIELAEPKKVISIPIGKERILFVDDEPDIASMGQEMLERLGYSVTAKTDSLTAIEEFCANSGKYDLVVTDFTMPKLNGLELAIELSKIYPDVRIILTTGLNEAIAPEKLKISGISTIIMKPYEITELAIAIRQIFDSKKSD